jgi:polysaccharide pyruvyl transferase WcaK-like protein/coenzyme F420-reducing hydrogenase beta subunit
VCPFAAYEPNEDQIAATTFGGEGLRHAPELGFFRAAGAAWIRDDKERVPSSSGGLGTWVAKRLLASGDVDGVIHVRPVEPADQAQGLFAYRISRTVAEIEAGRTSRYYPVEMSLVLREVLQHPGQRFVLFGIPCFIKAFRRLCGELPELGSIVPFTVGLVCGHLKDRGFAESLALQLGVDPAEMATINFRRKVDGQRANNYAIEVTFAAADGKPARRAAPTSGLYGTNWGHCFFRYAACDFCDDIFAETADFVIGDAWLPQYAADWRGTNVIVARHPRLLEILDQGVAEGEVVFEPLAPDEMARSQQANFRHRRESLWLRARSIEQRGEWHPATRFEHMEFPLTAPRRDVIDLRRRIAAKSRAVWSASRRELSGESLWRRFRTELDPLVDEYEHASHCDRRPQRTAVRATIDGIKSAGMATLRLSLRLTRLLRRGGDSPIIVLPPSSPGSLGDQAVMTAVFEQLLSVPGRRVVVLGYAMDDDWTRSAGCRLETVDVGDFFGWGSNRSLARLMVCLRSAHQLVVCGTDVLDGQYNVQRSIRRLRTVELAVALGVPVTVLGFSYSEHADPLARRVLRGLAGKARFCVRDPISFEVVAPVAGGRAVLVADPAFLLTARDDSDLVRPILDWIVAQRGAGRQVLGINVNHLLLSHTAGATPDALVASVAEALRQLRARLPSLAFCLLPHDSRGTPSDFVLADALAARLRADGHPATVTLPRSISAAEVKGVVQHLDAVFTGKMHLAIAALGSGVPVGAIVYKDRKFHGLFRHFGLERWLLTSESWSEPEQLSSFIAALVEQRSEIAASLQNRLPQVLSLARANFTGLAGR